MENRRLTAFVVVAGMVFGLGFVASLPAKEVDPQDQGTSIGNVPEAIIEIPAMTVPSVTLDFDLMAAGPTSVAAIQAQFPSAMSDMAFSPCTGSIPGTYDTQPNGRALAADPSGSLGLYLVNPGGGFGCFDDLTVNFSQQITEFGVQIGDWIGPMNIIVYDGATNVLGDWGDWQIIRCRCGIKACGKITRNGISAWRRSGSS